MAKRGLGKGLSSLIPGADIETPASNNYTNTNIQTKEVVKEVKINEPLMVKTRDIDPNKSQPRKNFDEEALKELADSIRQYGIVQPIVVRKNGKRYEIIAGERRWRAARLAAVKEVPVIVKEYSEREMAEIAIIENIQREDLNPVEEAMAYKKLLEEFGLKQEEMAQRLGKNRASIADSLRLLKLDEEVLKMLEAGNITSGHAKVILSLEDAEKQREAAGIVIEKSLSVRETEKLVKALLKEKPETVKPDLADNAQYERIREKLCEKFSTKVAIKRKSSSKGKIEIEYYSFEELERILEEMGAFANKDES